tara:strand:+ start:79 stop:726 length:648 start_codon:yes stop_codon:yes gene_type:complete
MNFQKARIAMVDCQVRPSDVTRYNVIDAMLTIKREEFVPRNLRSISYSENHLKINNDRYILDPRTTAKMLDACNIKKNDLVLDIASGYGYSSALISRLAETVISLEEEFFVEEAKRNLSSQSIDNAIVCEGELSNGEPKYSLYDVICIQGGVEIISKNIIDQLKVGGRLICIMIENNVGMCALGLKLENGIDWMKLFNANSPLINNFKKEKKFHF